MEYFSVINNVDREVYLLTLRDNHDLLSERYDMGNNLGKFSPKYYDYLDDMIWGDFIDFVLWATHY